MTKAEMAEKKDFHRAALDALRAAYLAIAEGGAQQYSIGSRAITKIDLPKIRAEMAEHEKQIAVLDNLMKGKGRRKAVGIVPRDW